MIAPLKPGVTLLQDGGPVIETERLMLRQWRAATLPPNTAMLSDPGTARFITVDGKPVVDEMTGWRHAVVMAGHWTLHGAGMFVVEEKSSGKYRRTGRAVVPPGWPGFEVGWGIATNSVARVMRWKRRGLRSTGRLRPSRSTRSSTASTPERPSQGVARRLGASTDREIELFGKTNERWVTRAIGGRADRVN